MSPRWKRSWSGCWTRTPSVLPPSGWVWSRWSSGASRPGSWRWTTSPTAKSRTTCWPPPPASPPCGPTSLTASLTWMAATGTTCPRRWPRRWGPTSWSAWTWRAWASPAPTARACPPPSSGAIGSWAISSTLTPTRPGGTWSWATTIPAGPWAACGAAPTPSPVTRGAARTRRPLRGSSASSRSPCGKNTPLP